MRHLEIHLSSLFLDLCCTIDEATEEGDKDGQDVSGVGGATLCGEKQEPRDRDREFIEGADDTVGGRGCYSCTPGRAVADGKCRYATCDDASCQVPF